MKQIIKNSFLSIIIIMSPIIILTLLGACLPAESSDQYPPQKEITQMTEQELYKQINRCVQSNSSYLCEKAAVYQNEIIIRALKPQLDDIVRVEDDYGH